MIVSVEAPRGAFERVVVQVEAFDGMNEELRTPPYDLAFRVPAGARSGPATIRVIGIRSGSPNQTSAVAIKILPPDVLSQLAWLSPAPHYLLAHPQYVAGGSLAALLLALLCSIRRPRVRRLRHLVVAAVLGGLAMLPVQAYVMRSSRIDVLIEESSALTLSYAVWPALVGAYLYWLRSRAEKLAPREDLGLGSGLFEVFDLLPVATLFVATGTCSATLSGDTIFGGVAMPSASYLLRVPLPFAILAPLLLLRSWRAVVAAPLFVAVWIIAWMAAIGGVSVLLPMLVGGFVGGLGLALACSVGRPAIRVPVRSAAVLGCVAAVPFQVIFWPHVSSHPSGVLGKWSYWELATLFAVWQPVVGSYLYWVCDQLRGREMEIGQPAPSP
jgi:hypothetical protein